MCIYDWRHDYEYGSISKEKGILDWNMSVKMSQK